MGSVFYKGVPGFPAYKVGTDGSVWSRWIRKNRSTLLSDKWKELNPYIMKSGYRQLTLCSFSLKKKVYVHRLVLKVFVGPCPKRFVGCHNDGKPENNHLKNLRWDSRKNNQIDMILHGKSTTGEKNPGAKLTIQKVKRIRRKYKSSSKVTQSELAKKYLVTRKTIGNIVNGKSWVQV